jgi:Flp pilus assembly protein CpaB
VARLVAARHRRRWRRAVARHRRLLAAGLLGAAVAAALQARSPAARPTEQVLVAAHDLPAGRTVEPGDTRIEAWLSGTAPRGAQAGVTGRVLAAAVRAGEPITDARLSGPGLLAGQPVGIRAVSVRLADPSGGWLVRPGDRVDVLAAWTGGAPVGPESAPGADPARSIPSARRADPVDVVVEGAVVLSSPLGCTGGSTGAGGGPLAGLTGDGGAPTGCPGAAGPGPASTSGAGVLLLAVDAGAARRLAAAVVGKSLSVAIRR